MAANGTLRPVLALEDQPGMAKAIAGAVAASVGKVCAVCGLEAFGHGPASGWLGYARHEFTPRPASPADVERANRLVGEAYRRRP